MAEQSTDRPIASLTPSVANEAKFRWFKGALGALVTAQALYLLHAGSARIKQEESELARPLTFVELKSVPQGSCTAKKLLGYTSSGRVATVADLKGFKTFCDEIDFNDAEKRRAMAASQAEALAPRATSGSR